MPVGIYTFGEVVQFTVGPPPHEVVLRSIELYGTQVGPPVRAEIARRKTAAAQHASGAASQ